MLFERFYTADPSRARLKGGTGLGLAIVKSVVNAHRGFIAASATQGGGLTFSILLPLGPVAAASDAVGEGMGGQEAGGKRAGRSTGRSGGRSRDARESRGRSAHLTAMRVADGEYPR